MTDRLKRTMAAAHELAVEQRSAAVEPGHLLFSLGAIDCGVGRCVLDGLGVDLAGLLGEIRAVLPQGTDQPPPKVEFGPRTDALLAAARSAAASLNHRYLGTEHLVLALLRDPAAAGEFLRRRGVTFPAARGSLTRLLAQDEDELQQGARS